MKNKSAKYQIIYLLILTLIFENGLVIPVYFFIPAVRTPNLLDGLIYTLTFVFSTCLALLVLSYKKKMSNRNNLARNIALLYLFFGVVDMIFAFNIFDVLLRVIIYPLLAYLIVRYAGTKISKKSL